MEQDAGSGPSRARSSARSLRDEIVAVTAVKLIDKGFVRASRTRPMPVLIAELALALNVPVAALRLAWYRVDMDRDDLTSQIVDDRMSTLTKGFQ